MDSEKEYEEFIRNKNPKTMEEYKFSDYINLFASLMLYPRHRELSQKTYERFPKKIKKRLKQHNIMICDWFYKAKFPEKRISGMPIAFYGTGSKLIDIIPEESKSLSDKGFIGLIAHETAHAIINNSFNPIRKKLFNIKFNKLPIGIQNFYREPEELHADWLAKKWGFVKEIDALNDERVIKK